MLASAMLHAGDPVSSKPASLVRVVDGDTLSIDGVIWRLEGIDAPEVRQAGGTEATIFLAGLVHGREVICRELDRDRYGRLIGACTADGVGVNAAMVASGHAWAFVRYSEAYVGAEQAARIAGAGIWGARGAVAPWDWRKGSRAAANDNLPASAASGCPVKVSRSGIAHDTGSRWYARTKTFTCYSNVRRALADGARLPRP